MEGSLPQELLDVFERSTTADFVTVDDHGRPLAWSVEPSFDAQAVCIAVGRAPTLRQALVDPHVALLFADEPPQPVVLVQGTAKVGEEDLRVRPERVYVWQRADLDAEPELYDSHVEEVRSAHNEEPEVGHAPPEGGPPAWDERLDELGTTHASAVLAFVGPDRFPFAVRVPVRADRAAGLVRIGADPVGAPIEPGVGCLRAAELRVRGDLEEEHGGWVLRPHAMVGAAER
jgi:Pyridoxamine 5'-phosphate oxidase